MNVIDISSMQFSQEADLSSKATYDLTLERFSTSDDVYRLEVLDLPRQISYDFTDGESKVTQIKFAQGVNIKKLSLQVYLPDRDDQQVVIDKPIKFQVQTVTASNGEKAGSENLEIIPRGKGKIEVRANNLYHETTVGKEVVMDVTVRNGGTRRLDNRCNQKPGTGKGINGKSNHHPAVGRWSRCPGSEDQNGSNGRQPQGRYGRQDSPHPGKCFDFCLRHHLPDPVAGWLYRGNRLVRDEA